MTKKQDDGFSMGILAPVLNKAVHVAKDTSIKTLNLLFDGFDDYSVPAEMKDVEAVQKDRDSLTKAIQNNPLDRRSHYNLARWHQEHLEFQAAKYEFEIANFLQPLSETENHYYSLCLLQLRQSCEYTSSFIAFLNDKYPEFLGGDSQ